MIPVFIPLCRTGVLPWFLSAAGDSLMAGMGKNPLSAEITDKLYYPIREVAQITGVEPYVLRFWEKEFPMIRPPKGGTGHRRYRRKDIETILEIKRLLYDEGFTIAGARSRLQNAEKPAESPRAAASAAQQKKLPYAPSSGAVLQRVRRELNEILTILNKP
ncbi:MAG: transcriptional regulator, MerR family [Acidobacteria bacterium]|nr:transcriptional regulator, MerR family [Acidobacteriota bacterium]